MCVTGELETRRLSESETAAHAVTDWELTSSRLSVQVSHHTPVHSAQTEPFLSAQCLMTLSAACGHKPKTDS